MGEPLPPYLTEAGIWCRACGNVNLWVIQTSHGEEGVVRLRRCRSCRTVFRSIEVYLSPKHGDVTRDYPHIPGKTPQSIGNRSRGRRLVTAVK